MPIDYKKVLVQNENNYLCAIVLDDLQCGIALLDCSTGELLTCSRNKMELNKKKYPVQLSKGNATKYNRRKG